MKKFLLPIVFGFLCLTGFAPMGSFTPPACGNAHPITIGWGGPGGGPELCGVALVNGDELSECSGGGFGNCPYSMSLVTDVLKFAKDHFSKSLGQMIQEYHGCRCVLTYLGMDPAGSGKSVWRVTLGGGGVIVLAEGL